MAVYRNIKIDIPKEHVTIERQKNGSPALIKYVLSAPYNREKGYPEPKRTTIGHQCPGEESKMYPTTQYARIFPQEWEKVSGEKTVPATKRIGLFSLCQAINMKTGIKDLLDGAFGVDNADAIMDFAMYSILHHSDAVVHFQSEMKNELLYTGGDGRDDKWYAGMFDRHLTKEQILLFNKNWLTQCKAEGAEGVWLCIDGSNDDCHSRGVTIAEKGHAKSGGTGTPIVSFTYAVTDTGLPVTFDTYHGGLVNFREMKKVLDFITGYGFKVNGVILDRGYCNADILDSLNENKIPYVIMVKGQPQGVAEVADKYGALIRLNAEYLVDGAFLFGIQQKCQLFKSCKREDCVTLFYDYQNGSERITALLRKLYKAKAKINEQLLKGENEPEIEKQFEDMIEIITEKDENGRRRNIRRAVIKASGLQKELDAKGLYSVVSSDEMPPEKVHERYATRDESEIQFRFVKSQLGYGTVHVQSDATVYARFFVGFVSAILRYEIWQASKPLCQSVTQMLMEADRMEMERINNVYTYTHTEKEIVRDLFLNINPEVDVTALVDESVKMENDRLEGRVPVLRHRKPGPKKGSHRKKYDAEGSVIRKTGGVPAGTKRSDINKNGTLRKKPGTKPGTKMGKYNKDGSLRQKPGPKPGTHNKRTTLTAE